MKASGLLDTRPAIENIIGADLFANGDSALPEGTEKDEPTGEFDQETDAVEEEVLEDVPVENFGQDTDEDFEEESAALFEGENSEEESEEEIIEEKESA